MLKFILSTLMIAGLSSASLAQSTNAGPGGKHEGPCKQIQDDCAKAGYVVGEAKEGKGMWWDCMCPLIAQNFPEPKNNVLSVPSDANLVSQCRSHPRGPKIQARCADMLAKKNARQQNKK